MRQQFSLSLPIKLLVFMMVTIRVDGYIFDLEEEERVFDHDLENQKEVLQFVNRSEWGAVPMTESVETLITPVPYVMIYHTGTESCFYRKSCDAIVRSLQAKYIPRDIGYNFLISGDGKVYIGRNWEIVGAHTLGLNKKSIGIALIGTFYDHSPSTYQFFTLEFLIKYGVYSDHIHRQFKYYSEMDLHFSIDPKHHILGISDVIDNLK